MEPSVDALVARIERGLLLNTQCFYSQSIVALLLASFGSDDTSQDGRTDGLAKVVRLSTREASARARRGVQIPVAARGSELAVALTADGATARAGVRRGRCSLASVEAFARHARPQSFAVYRRLLIAT